MCVVLYIVCCLLCLMHCFVVCWVAVFDVGVVFEGARCVVVGLLLWCVNVVVVVCFVALLV